MKTCEEYMPALSAFADGELNEAEKSALLAHLEQCEACREALSELMLLHAMFEDLPELDAPDGFAERVLARIHEDAPIAKKKPRRRALRTLAACAALVLIAGAVWVMPGVNLLGATSDSSTPESADTNGAAQQENSSTENDYGDEDIYDVLWSDSVQYDGSSYGNELSTAGGTYSSKEDLEAAQNGLSGANYLNVRVDDAAAAEFLAMNGMSVYAETTESVSFLVTPTVAHALAGESIVTAAEADVLSGATELMVVEIPKQPEESAEIDSEAEDTAPEDPAEGAALPAEGEVAE